MTKKKAFTLIELLIVVAIIAILAAIAVPNFLEAQTRSKVARVKADMRTLATGVESYFVDNNRYPPDRNYAGTAGLPAPFPQGWTTNYLAILTTPIAYLSSVGMPDPFFDKAKNAGANNPGQPLEEILGFY